MSNYNVRPRKSNLQITQVLMCVQITDGDLTAARLRCFLDAEVLPTLYNDAAKTSNFFKFTVKYSLKME